MVLFELFKDLYSSGMASIKHSMSRAILRNNNSTCIFYPGVKIGKSTFERCNVIFENVAIYNSNIGAHTYIQKNSRVFNSNIGRFCSIASNVSIAPGLHKTSGLSTHPAFYLKDTPLAITFSETDSIPTFSRVTIGHDVWIGENSIILDGVSIGTGAIIAAGSIVTKDVEPYSIIGGVPAKVLKYRFSDEIISEVLKSEWWNKPDTWLKENYKLFHNPIEFLSSIRTLHGNI
jgi:acetyltransferase-like isoleucine patch superfamily enzyme